MTERERIAREFIMYIWNKEPWRIAHIDREGQGLRDGADCPTREEYEYALSRFVRYYALSEQEAREWWEEHWEDDDAPPPQS